MAVSATVRLAMMSDTVAMLVMVCWIRVMRSTLVVLELSDSVELAFWVFWVIAVYVRAPVAVFIVDSPVWYGALELSWDFREDWFWVFWIFSSLFVKFFLVTSEESIELIHSLLHLLNIDRILYFFFALLSHFVVSLCETTVCFELRLYNLIYLLNCG